MILKKLFASSAVFVAGVLVFTSIVFADMYKATNDSVNVRQNPSTEAAILGQVNTDEKVDVVDSIDGWKKIKYGNGYGWIFSQFLKATGDSSSEESTETVTVLVPDVNLREGPSTEYTIKTCFDKGTILTLISNEGDWYKVKSEDGTTGWVLSSLVSSKGRNSSSSSGSSSSSQRTTAPITSRGNEGNGERKSESRKSESRKSESRNTDIRGRIISFAKKFMRVPYVYGGTSARGFDCSGFVKYVYANFGICLERTAAEQAEEGTWVSRANLRPGDVLFFATDGGGKDYINHSGIYLGDGYFVHASSGHGSVTISSLNESFYSRCHITSKSLLK